MASAEAMADLAEAIQRKTEFLGQAESLLDLSLPQS